MPNNQNSYVSENNEQQIWFPFNQEEVLEETQLEVEPASRTLLADLQAGGLILYSRHAEANVGVDQQFINFQDCATQRNLGETGRTQAITFGETLRQLQIPIMYPVSVSPFCRTYETGALAFGANGVQVDPFWADIYRLSGPLDPMEQARILYQLQTVLETPPTPGSNKVIIAHSFPSGVGLDTLPNMGTIVVRPRGQGNGYEVVAYLTLNDLTNLG
ncbi:histidine phosphatase family protein [Bacillus alkalicellulosilyticus]|uniref:histidine phosphatase family protein n=1 Tax=Alkalihalobacterium alkalicellulosilyticum TaxID=1912214 RepID=UPI001FE9DD29|nr:histidine phosphatase family protein [Bacillus alkalicellulosilyticus]